MKIYYFYFFKFYQFYEPENNLCLKPVYKKRAVKILLDFPGYANQAITKIIESSIKIHKFRIKKIFCI